MSDELDDPGGGPEDCFVETMPLAEIINSHVKRWRERHPKTSSRDPNGYYSTGGTGGVQTFAAHEWLSMKTRLSEATIRRAQNPAQYPRTRLEIADALVAAIGDPQVFRDGTLRVSCCGGSSSDAASST